MRCIRCAACLWLPLQIAELGDMPVHSLSITRPRLAKEASPPAHTDILSRSVHIPRIAHDHIPRLVSHSRRGAHVPKPNPPTQSSNLASISTDQPRCRTKGECAAISALGVDQPIRRALKPDPNAPKRIGNPGNDDAEVALPVRCQNPFSNCGLEMPVHMKQSIGGLFRICYRNCIYFQPDR